MALDKFNTPSDSRLAALNLVGPGLLLPLLLAELMLRLSECLLAISPWPRNWPCAGAMPPKKTSGVFLVLPVLPSAELLSRFSDDTVD
jgi:hypothetical protein